MQVAGEVQVPPHSWQQAPPTGRRGLQGRHWRWISKHKFDFVTIACIEVQSLKETIFWITTTTKQVLQQLFHMRHKNIPKPVFFFTHQGGIRLCSSTWLPSVPDHWRPWKDGPGFDINTYWDADDFYSDFRWLNLTLCHLPGSNGPRWAKAGI